MGLCCNNKMPVDKTKLFLILSRVALLVLIITPLCIKDWISQGEGGEEWEGSLTSVTDGPRDSGYDWTDESYDDISRHFCDEKDSDFTSEESAFCDSFDKLHSGGAAFIAFSSICIFIWIVVSIQILRLIKGNSTFCARMSINVLSVTSCVFYGIGYAVWMGCSKSEFTTHCNDMYNEDDWPDTQKVACAETGAKFALATLILKIVYNALFLYYLKHKPFEEHSYIPSAPYIPVIQPPQYPSAFQPSQPYQPPQAANNYSSAEPRMNSNAYPSAPYYSSYEQ